MARLGTSPDTSPGTRGGATPRPRRPTSISPRSPTHSPAKLAALGPFNTTTGGKANPTTTITTVTTTAVADDPSALDPHPGVPWFALLRYTSPPLPVWPPPLLPYRLTPETVRSSNSTDGGAANTVSLNRPPSPTRARPPLALRRLTDVDEIAMACAAVRSSNAVPAGLLGGGGGDPGALELYWDEQRGEVVAYSYGIGCAAMTVGSLAAAVPLGAWRRGYERLTGAVAIAALRRRQPRHTSANQLVLSAAPTATAPPPLPQFQPPTAAVQLYNGWTQYGSSASSVAPGRSCFVVPLRRRAAAVDGEYDSGGGGGGGAVAGGGWSDPRDGAWLARVLLPSDRVMALFAYMFEDAVGVSRAVLSLCLTPHLSQVPNQQPQCSCIKQENKISTLAADTFLPVRRSPPTPLGWCSARTSVQPSCWWARCNLHIRRRARWCWVTGGWSRAAARSWPRWW